MTEGDPPPRTNLRRRIAELIGRRPGSDATSAMALNRAGDVLGLRVSEFEEASVADVMTPRVDITAVDIDSSLDDVLKLFVAEAHSRMPVYRDSLDSPLGFVHIKDIVAELVEAGWSPETLASRPLDRLLREVMFVPESMPLPDLLRRMQSSRMHMAIVIDEFGGTDGLVCLEDVVEEIVGDLEDEHDEISPAAERRGRNTWDVDGLAEIEQVEELTGLALGVAEFEDEVETMGGLVSALAGRVPKASDSIPHPNGLALDVLAADPRRVLRVRIRPTAKPQLANDHTAEPVGQPGSSARREG